MLVCFNQIINYLEDYFHQNIISIKGSGFFAIICFVYFKKTFLYAYLFFLVNVLLLREGSSFGYSYEHYFGKWIKLLFTNKIVFLNVFGNIALFVPLGYALKSKPLVWGIILAFGFEILQIILKKGIFDLMDVVLNVLGIVLGFRSGVYERRKR